VWQARPEKSVSAACLKAFLSPQKTLIMTEIVPRYFLVHIHNLAVFFAVPKKKK
jgi:hypothetical protein